MKQPRRIAIYGGTFDPVHKGHLEIARKVSQLFAIDEFLFVPARLAPHKTDREVSSALDRFAMLVLATHKDAKLCVSRFELEGPERQFTVDTLSHFRSKLGDTSELFFVLGADSWAEITSWREWERLATLANLVVVTRPGFEFSSGNPAIDNTVVDVRGMVSEEILQLVEPGKHRVFITDAAMIDVSATEARRAAQEQRDDLNQMVPLEVADYIRKYNLYRNTNEA